MNFSLKVILVSAGLILFAFVQGAQGQKKASGKTSSTGKKTTTTPINNSKKPVANNAAKPTAGKNINNGSTGASGSQASPQLGQGTPASSGNLGAVEPYYQSQVQQIIEFLELIFNELGSDETPLQDKEEIINSSYLKAFRDNKVQIEDDLDTRRTVATNKDVQAYLKDIDFFFRHAEFKLTPQRTEYLVAENGMRVIKVTLNRQLNATLLDGSSITHNQLRYIEMNVDTLRREVKIASIYTNRLDEAQELQQWWSNLTPEWKNLIAPQFANQQEMTFEQLRSITQLETLDLSSPAVAKQITSFEPLAELTGLRSLKLAHTSIVDLWPLRNLARLENLDLSNTSITQLDALKYLSSLQQLNLSNTAVEDLSPISNLVQLQQLNISGTRVSSWEALASLVRLQTLQATNLPATTLEGIEKLTALQFLDVSGSKITNIEPLANLPAIERLYLDDTGVNSLAPLRGKTTLQLLSINNTRINNLAALGNMPALERLYADGTPLTRQEINQFIAVNPKCLVMNNSDQMASWWEQLPRPWRSVIITYVRVTGTTPTREQLAQIARLTEIDLSGRTDITNLDPLKALYELKKIRCNSTGISSLAPLQFLDNLQHLECRATAISDLSPLAGLRQLHYLDISNTKVASLAPIQHLPELAWLYADQTAIPQKEFVDYINAKPDRTVVFMSQELNRWWQQLAPEWKQVFRQATGIKKETLTTEELHQIAKLHTLSIPAGVRITSLTPLEMLFRLHEFNFSNTLVQDLSPLTKVTSLRILRLPNNPVHSLAAIHSLTNLEVLDIQSTPIEKIEELLPFTNLRELNISGTPIKRLKGIEQLQKLERLSFYSTSISNIRPLESLPRLKKVQCFRTKLTLREVENFRRLNPKCEVEFY